MRCIAKTVKDEKCSRGGRYGGFCSLHYDYLDNLEEKLKLIDKEIKRVSSEIEKNKRQD